MNKKVMPFVPFVLTGLCLTNRLSIYLFKTIFSFKDKAVNKQASLVWDKAKYRRNSLSTSISYVMNLFKIQFGIFLEVIFSVIILISRYLSIKLSLVFSKFPNILKMDDCQLISMQYKYAETAVNYHHSSL